MAYDPALIADTAQEILDTVAAELGADAPTHQYVSHGAPAWDLCKENQLTVHVNFAHRQTRNAKSWQNQEIAIFTVQLVRCVPGLDGDKAPTDAVLDLSAKDLLIDAHRISHALRDNAGAIFGDCSGVSYGSGVVLGPSGLVGGWSFEITWQVSE